MTGYLWIDAICINQATTLEKNHQVSMMGMIYSQAECVIVWLGNCDIAMDRNVGDVLAAVDRRKRMERLGLEWS